MEGIKGKEFYHQLEGFRGIAILLVLISHFIVIHYFPKLIPLNLGFLGVNLFFVLSGFLITEILLKESRSGQSRKVILKNFFAKRGLRIFPIYFLSILLLILLGVPGLMEQLFWIITYTVNIKENFFGGQDKLFMHIWSLCVEEQFYMFWPFLILFVPKQYLLGLFLAVISSAIIFRFSVSFFLVPGFGSLNHSFPLACLDALALGGLLAYLKMEKPGFYEALARMKVVPFILLFFFYLISFFLPHESFLTQTLERFIAGLIGFFLVAFCAVGRLDYFGKLLQNKFLCYLGKISYGIYLYHWLLYFLLKEGFIDIWAGLDFGVFQILKYHQYLGVFVVFSTLSVLAASFSFYLVEKPILQLKKRYG